MHRLSRWVAPLAALLLASCSANAPPTSTPQDDPVSAGATAATPSGSLDAAAADLALLLDRLETIHPEPFHGIPRDDFVSALEAHAAAMPRMTPEESVVGLMRVVALLSREGRDGHQFALPATGHEGPVLPLRIYEFAEGVFVTAARDDENAALVGTRITAVGDTPIEEVLAAVEPLVPRDGPATVPAFRPVLMLRTEVLIGLGIIEPGAVALAYDGAEGDGTATLEPIPFDEYVEWAGGFGMLQLPADDEVRYLADPSPLMVDRLEDGATLYVRYRSVVPPDMGSARAELAAGGVERLVLDLRQNPGGDNTTYAPLLSFVRDFAQEHPGSVSVLTDRVTFSAAANLATEIEQRTDARFVGEPMGGGLNFWDDVRFVRLDALPVPMQVGVSTRYWQKAEPDEERLTIQPDIEVPVTAADYFGHRDPAIDAATSAP